MNFKNIFIVTYGRTGSTLLQGIINTIDKVYLGGENMGMCLGLYKTYLSIIRAKSMIDIAPSPVTHPFYGSERLSVERYLVATRQLLRDQIVPHDLDNVICWGFKEIRYVSSSFIDVEDSSLPGYLDFLRSLFPQAAFLILTRRHSEVVDSGFWKIESPSNVIPMLNAFETDARNWSESNKANTHWMDYSDLSLDNGGVQRLMEFLGVEWNNDAIVRTIETQHSYSPKVPRD